MNINELKNQINSFFKYIKSSADGVIKKKSENKGVKQEKYDIGIDDVKKAYEGVPKKIGYGTLGIGIIIILIMTIMTVRKDVAKAKKERVVCDVNKTNEEDVQISIDEQGWKHYQSKKIEAVSERTNNLIKEASKQMKEDSLSLKQSLAKDMNSTLNSVKKMIGDFSDKFTKAEANSSKKIDNKIKLLEQRLSANEKSKPKSKTIVSISKPKFNSNSQLLPPPLNSLSSDTVKTEIEVKEQEKIVYIEPDEDGYDYMDIEIDGDSIETTDIQTSLFKDANESVIKKGVFHVMKGLVKATLLTGVNASTFGGGATKNPSGAIVFSIDGDTFIANNELENIGDCLISGSATGNVNTSKADILLTEISCSGYNKDGKRIRIEQDIKGWAIGEDGSFGLKGRLVDSSGKVITKMIALEVIQALADALVVSAQPNGTAVGVGRTTALSYDSAAQKGLGAGVKGGLDNAFNHYTEILSGMYPTISVRAGKKISLLLKGGEDLSPIVYKSIDIDEEFEVENESN